MHKLHRIGSHLLVYVCTFPVPKAPTPHTDPMEDIHRKGITDDHLETILDIVHLKYIIRREGGTVMWMCACTGKLIIILLCTVWS